MEPPSSHAITIRNSSGVVVSPHLLRRAIKAALNLQKASPSSVSILFASDEEVQELNKTYRGVDSATDVLSFASDDPHLLGARKFIGDIAIAIPYAERQAVLRGVTLAQEVAYLAIHGTLHLLGFDDEEPEERKLMWDAMSAAADEVGLPSEPEWASLLQAEETSA